MFCCLWHGTAEEAAGVAATDHNPRAQVRAGCSGGMCAAVAAAAAVPARSQQQQQQPEPLGPHNHRGDPNP